MSKIQTILLLFVLLIVIFSMDMIFGDLLREPFKGINVPVGSELNYTYDPNKKINPGFLGVTDMHEMKSDDQPLYFGFSL